MISQYEHLIRKFRHRFIDKRLQPLGLGGPQTIYLTELYKMGDGRMNDMIEGMPFHKSHATRVIADLQERGLLEKLSDPADARAVLLHLTKSGIIAAKAVLAVLNEWDELMFSSLSETEKNQMEAIYRKMHDHIAAKFAEEESHA
jgi:DNA-binding MarR family transcriptional regulator